MVAADGNARRMNLRVTGIRKQSAAFVGTIRRRDIAAVRVRTQIVGVRVSAGCNHNGIRVVRFNLAREKVGGSRSRRPDH